MLADHLELYLKAVVSILMWMVGTKLRSSARAGDALNRWAVSLVLPYRFQYKRNHVHQLKLNCSNFCDQLWSIHFLSYIIYDCI